MNYIPKIAEMFGVKIGEEFEANGKTVKFTEDTFVRRVCDSKREWWVQAECTLLCLINGSLEVKKLPFEPKNGERYYYVRFARNSEGKVVSTVFERAWEAEMRDYENKLYGNRFRTMAEAKFEAPNVYKRLTGVECEKITVKDCD